MYLCFIFMLCFIIVFKFIILKLVYFIYIKENLDRGPREDYPARG